MAEFTEEQLKEAARRAVADGNIKAAEELAAAARSVASGQGVSTAPPREMPDGMVTNPTTGQITERSLMAGNMEPGLLAAMGQGYMQGYSWSGADELAGAVGGDYARERFRAANDAAWRDHPVATFLGALAGGVGGAVGLGKAANAGMRALGMKGIAPATTAIGRGLQMAGGGAVGGGVEGFLAGEGGAESRAKTAAIGAAGGFIAAPTFGFAVSKVADVAGRVGGKVLRNVFSKPQFYDPNTGALTDQGRQVIRTLGYNVDELTDRMNVELAKAAEDATQGRIPDGVGPRVAVANRFDVPLTKGQMTGDIPQIAAEEQFRAGIRGGGALDTIREFDMRQGAAIGAAREGLVPGPEGGRIDAASSVIDAVRREADTARDAGRAAYNVLEESGAAVDASAKNSLRRVIESAMESRGARVSGSTANAMDALDAIENAFRPDNNGAIPFTKLEDLRQDLLVYNRAAQATGTGRDKIAMQTLLNEFDGWIDDTITNALVSGDDTILANAKNARALWAKYRNTFLGKKGADNFIRKIVEDDLSPNEVSNWLFGASSKVGGGRTSLVARRVKDIVGVDSPEWSAVRRAAWDRTTLADSGEMFGPDKLVTNLTDLLDGKGKPLSDVLFTADERKAIREFRNLMKVLQKPRKATNPSGTGYEIQRAAGQVMRMLTGIAGNSAGGPLGGIMASGAVDTGGRFSSTVAARAAARGLSVPSLPPTAAIGAGQAGVGSARGLITSLQDRETR